MRIIAALNFLLVTALFIVTAFWGVAGNIIVNELTHLTILTCLPIMALNMLCVALNK
tara:strand:- start:363 stop:533 length:171 start_codon:yes stop_codon:yes gene_type:complete